MNGLFGHIQRNNFLSLILFAVFLLMFELLALCPVVIVDLQTGHIGSGLLAEYLRQTVSGVLQHGLWLPPAILGVVWLAFAWRYYRTIVQDEIHASPLPRAEAPQLCQLAETLAISAGLPTPRLLVIESEARNAFAIGFSPADAAIFVTRGLLERLAPDEIEAVLAHEISHIANRDTRLLAAAALSAGIVMRLAWLLAALFLRASPLIKLILYLCAGYYFLDVLGLIAWACLFATICALAARLAISQARELVADACAIELTKNPDALISALRKMHGHEQVAGLDLFLQAMLISPTNGHLFVAHPPLEARVVVLQRLLPSMVKPDRSPEPHRVAETLWSWRRTRRRNCRGQPAGLDFQLADSGARDGDQSIAGRRFRRDDRKPVEPRRGHRPVPRPARRRRRLAHPRLRRRPLFPDEAALRRDPNAFRAER